MKYELTKLDKIILVLIVPENFMKQAQKAAILKKWLTMVIVEKERIQGQFLNDLFNCENENRMKYYIQQHQQALLKLSDSVYHYLQPGNQQGLNCYTISKTHINSFKKIQENIEDLLLFIRQHFKIHCSVEIKISDHAASDFVRTIKPVLGKVRSVFNYHTIEKSLSDIACAPLEEYISGSQVISQRRQEFMERYAKELSLVLDQQIISQDDIYHLMIQSNQNGVEFFRYFTNSVKEKAENITGIGALIEYYSELLKWINQLPGKPMTAYDPTLPDTREQIGSWLSEEIYFLERKQQHEHRLPAEMESNPSFTKVHSNLSVGQLSLALKLLLATGVIKNKNTSELMRLVARNFRTEKSEHISEDSLRNKVYNIETAAVNGMKDVIIGLLNEVRKY